MMGKYGIMNTGKTSLVIYILTQLAEFYLQNSQKQPKFEVWKIFISLIFRIL